jgi:hypothetical protein
LVPGFPFEALESSGGWNTWRRRRVPALSWGRSFAGVICRRVASSWASDARAQLLTWPSPFPVDRSPASFNASSSRAIVLPFRVVWPPSQPSGLSTGLTFRGVFAPCNDDARTSPTNERGVPPPLGFRPQAFSTSRRFTSTLELHGLVSCRSRSWVPPSELVPRGDHVPLSKPLAPPQSSTSVRERTTRVLITAGLCRLPRASAQWPTSPDDYGSPFHETKPASRSPWVPSGGVAPFRQLHLPRGFPPPARPYPRAELPRPASRCSPGRSAPLETAHVRPSDPSPARASPDARWPPSQRCDAVDHDPRRSRTPTTPGRTSP